MARTTRRKIKPESGKFDRPLFFTWMVLVAIGLIMIASAGSIKAYHDFGDGYWYLKQQGQWLAVSIVGLIFFVNFDYRQLRYFGFPALIVTIVLLAIVFLPVIGSESINGAKRWLSIGPISMQPSELSKLVLAIYLAAWMERKGKEVKNFTYGFLPFVMVLMVVVFLLFMQRDLGTMLTIGFTAVVTFYVSGASVRQLGALVMTGVALVAALIIVEPYRVDRVNAWLNPADDLQGIAYQTEQCRLATSSGGIWGAGYGRGLQKYGYLPDPPTDSIYCMIGEELGFIGQAGVIFLYLFLLRRFMLIAIASRDQFGTLLTVSLGVWIGFQAFINIGGILRVIPLTGIPLPFISYGGTSLLMTTCAVGIVLNISRHVDWDKIPKASKKNPARRRGVDGPRISTARSY